MPSVSAVTICSNALLSLGESPINSFEESTDTARLCANKYPTIRDSVLRSHPWGCATRSVILSPETGKPAFGFNFRFPLPGDLLRILSVGIEGSPVRYRVEGRFILADVNLLPLRYIWRNDDESSWDSMLIRATEITVAAELAYAVTASASMAQLMEQKAQLIMQQARTYDSQEEPPETLYGTPSYDARF
ncbi:TPA: hypothetical protein H2R31_002932 [Salmonella enterica]|uniref:hypothetical protein n=1 Tax=Salmonella enterica TaxID=28901 RepID=UPI00193E406B|nr:hypothetical protein [Salmonella enterica]EEN5587732.1 hypothetical protein [Salmonella enterica subsp. enterica serovar Mountpleasant]EHK2735197.1 hypothetical protein [Salmonella enterica]HAK6117890.1 hypothetical protein [Salmonella enterica]HEC8456387.1 hypothetical protein [Salmonella enterica subsp. enterica serovar Poona]